MSKKRLPMPRKLQMSKKRLPMPWKLQKISSRQSKKMKNLKLLRN